MQLSLKIWTFSVSLLLAASPMAARQTDDLLLCWEQQVKPLQDQYLSFSYSETLHEWYHSPDPWQQLNYTGAGIVWCNADNFLKQDTLTHGKRVLYSKTQFNERIYLYQAYGRKDLSPVTPAMITEQLMNSARYSPVPLINYCYQQKIPVDKEKSNDRVSVYTAVIHKTIVSLYLDRHEHHLNKITILNDDELHGDVLTTFIYSAYAREGKLRYPKMIEAEKMNGRLKDKIKLLQANLVEEIPKLLDQPEDYKVNDDVETKPEIKIDKYSDNIHFIDLINTGAKSMVVTFRDFLLVAEAPLSSKNGALIINEAKKLAPGKPIKYFTFGHHHPHYLGGIRSFIHEGSIVLSTKEDEPYLRYLASAPRTLNPDSLQLDPRPIHLEEIKDSMTITDRQFEMKIYAIGKKSGHTNDYLVYYFPQEKLLFEGDLVWIGKNGEPKKAGAAQSGLYNAIKGMGLNVGTIVQSWVTSPDDYKTIIPFEDLEQAMLVK